MAGADAEAGLSSGDKPIQADKASRPAQAGQPLESRSVFSDRAYPGYVTRRQLAVRGTAVRTGKVGRGLTPGLPELADGPVGDQTGSAGNVAYSLCLRIHLHIFDDRLLSLFFRYLTPDVYEIVGLFL